MVIATDAARNSRKLGMGSEINEQIDEEINKESMKQSMAFELANRVQRQAGCAQTFRAAQFRQIDNRRALHDHRAKTLQQLLPRHHRAASCNQVVDEYDAFARLAGVF